MQINLNLPLALMTRFIRTLEDIRNDYRDVHAAELRQAREARDAAPDAGKFFYQSDRKLYEEELKARVERAAASGDYSLLQ